MNILFRLGQNKKGFDDIEETKDFFHNVLPKRDNNYFFNVNKLLQIQSKETIYFAYSGYLVAKATFTGEIIENYERSEKYNFGHKLINIQIINSDKKLNSDIVKNRTNLLKLKRKN